MKIRINKFIAKYAGVSRRNADNLISSKKVTVNGNVSKLGQIIDSKNDVVKLENKIIKPKDELVYYAIYKPVGYVSTTTGRYSEKKVTDLAPKDIKLFPVGRLDKNSEGLMILTNDGDFAYRLTHPKYEHKKKYIVKLANKNVSKEEIKRTIGRLKKGIRLKEGKAKFDEIKLISSDDLQFIVTIHQGWKRQIRRMFETLGYGVTGLKRLAIEKLDLKNLDLRNAKYKSISPEDVL